MFIFDGLLMDSDNSYILVYEYLYMCLYMFIYNIVYLPDNHTSTFGGLGQILLLGQMSLVGTSIITGDGAAQSLYEDDITIAGTPMQRSLGCALPLCEYKILSRLFPEHIIYNILSCMNLT